MIPTANIRRTPKKKPAVRPSFARVLLNGALRDAKGPEAAPNANRHRRARSASLLGPDHELRQQARRCSDAEAESDTNEEGRVQLKAGARAFGLDLTRVLICLS